MNTNKITNNGRIENVFHHFQYSFICIVANIGDEKEREELIVDYTNLVTSMARSVGGKLKDNATEEEGVNVVLIATREQVKDQRQLISLAKKRDAAHNN